MLLKTKPSTAHCTEAVYISYLLSDPCYTSCTRLSQIMGSISHDSVNRFLERERYDAKDLFEESRDKMECLGGVLSVDDSVLDKPYSDVSKAAFIDLFWSGKHKRVIKGINIISLFYTDIHGISVPVNYRICDKSSGKTKNDYFREMLVEVLSWGLKPSWVTDKQKVYLKDYGMVQVFRQIGKDTCRYYVMSVSDLDKLDEIGLMDFERVHSAHWNVERFHRAIKQVCNVERFQVRRVNPIKNHIFCALKAFIRLEFMRWDKIISLWYEVKRDLFSGAIRHFITQTTEISNTVNA